MYVIRHLSRLHIAAKLSKDNTRKNKNKDKDGTGTVVLLHKYTWYLFFCVMVIGMIGMVLLVVLQQKVAIEISRIRIAKFH